MIPTTNQITNILLIDDDEDDCLFLSKALAAISDQIELSFKQDSDHLLETIGSIKPCLIFMDYYMPKRRGIDLLRQIKTHPGYHHIPVIMWSTSLVFNHVIEAYKEGAKAFIQKPYCYKELVSEIKGVLLLNKIGPPDIADTYRLKV